MVAHEMSVLFLLVSITPQIYTSKNYYAVSKKCRGVVNHHWCDLRAL